MKRITEHTDHGIALRKDLDISVMAADFEKLQTIIGRLADYEDINRLPEEIQELRDSYPAVCRAYGVNNLY